MRAAPPPMPGDRVVIVGDHPHATEAGSLVALEEYGPGVPGGGLRWWGWLVALDAGGMCYAKAANLRAVKMPSEQRGMELETTNEEVGQGPPDTLEQGLQRWLRIAEQHAGDAKGYMLYPGDWGALADKLRRAIAALGA